MIPRDTIERVFSAAKIEDVVGEVVPLKKRGANLIGLCPFHDEKTGSFTVSPSKGIYKCFGCGKSGNVVGFVMEYDQCTYTEAIRTLAKRYHIEIEERELTKEEQQSQDDRESMSVVNEWSNSWFQKQLWDTQEGQAVGLSYLRARGLRDDSIHKFQLGYSPDKSLLSIEAKKAGYEEKYLVNDSQNAPYIGTGVCLKSEDGRLYDRFHSRVIFPFFSITGKVIGFAGRLMKQNDKVGKYVNSPTSPLFEKHNCLYGLFQAKQEIVRQNHCYLVEGQMDVISMFQAGIKNVVASGGTSLTQPQIKLMHRFTDRITVLYDGDKAGIKAAIRGIDMILEEGIKVKVLLLPDGEDPDSFAKSHTSEEMVDYIKKNETDFIRFKVELLSEEADNDPMKRSELIQSVIQSISVIPDAIPRQVYLKECAGLLDIQENILGREVSKLRRKRYGDMNKDTSADQQTEENTASDTPTVIVAPTMSEQVAEKRNSHLEANILNLLQVIVRHGEQVLWNDENGNSMMIGEYIIAELANDGITFSKEVYQELVNEYTAHCHEEGFVSEQYFLRHENVAISQLAVELAVDKYHLSSNMQQQEETDLQDLVSTLLLELKYTVVNERINAVQDQLNAHQQPAEEEMLLKQYTHWLSVRTAICAALGDRVITL